jgi:FAD/FMN-containing dehydrogenase
MRGASAKCHHIDCDGCPDEVFDIESEKHCDKILYCLRADKDEFARAAFQFNTDIPEHPSPCVVVMANDHHCLKAVIKYASSTDMKMAIRSGRHSFIGASTVHKGVVLDVSRFKKIEQHNDGTMTVGAGVTLGELYYELWKTQPKRLFFPGGTCLAVSISGLVLGGGQGVVGRKYGLSVDQVLEMKMVNAAGDDIVLNSENEHDGLFWALRGGGNGNYGVVYELTLKRYEIPEETTSSISTTKMIGLKLLISGRI